MDIMLFSSLTLMIFIIALILIIVEKTIKAIAFSILTLIIFSVIFGSFVVQDMRSLKENFLNDDKLIILQNKDEFITALIAGEELRYLNAEETLFYTTYIKERFYNTLLDDYYKIIFINVEALENIDERIPIGEKVLMKNQYILALTSNDPYSVLSKNGISKEDLFKDPPFNIENDRITLRAALLAKIYDGYIKDPSFFVENFKNNNIGLLPETAFFNLIKFLPGSAGKKLAAKFLE